jgi:hypothetical protein
MYIHIGGECTISDKYIVGIFDFDGTTGRASETIGFLKAAEHAGRVEVVSPELPRSFIVTLDRIYITPISPGTLQKRLSRAEGAEGDHDLTLRQTLDIGKFSSGCCSSR